ncbi:MAG: MFS transporter [Candidatus Dormibacteraceae bacterium]
MRTLTAGLVLQLAFGLVFAWGSFVPFVRSEWHWSPILIGAVFSGTPFGYGVGTLVGGRLADRLPARQICWLGMAALAVGFGTTFIFPTGFTFVVFYSALALGFGGGMALTGAVAVASRVLPQSIGMVGGGLTAAYATSVIFEAPLVALLAPRIGWFVTLRILGVGMALVAALVLLSMPPIPARIHSSPDPPSSQIQLVRRTTVWTSMLMLFSSATLGSYAAIDLVSHAQTVHLPSWVGTGALVGLALSNVASRLLGGFVADRVGADRVLATVLLFILLGAALMVFLGSTTGGVLGAGLAAGVPVGGGPGLMSKLAADSAPESPHSVFGILFASFASGALIGPLIGESIGGPGAWMVVAAPALGGLALFWLRARMRSSGVLQAA